MVKIRGTNRHLTKEGVVKRNPPTSPGMNPEIKEIAEQVGWRELRMAGFKFVYDNSKNSLSVMKGKKFVTIAYDVGADLYNVEIAKIKPDFTIESKKLEGVDVEQLRPIIMEHFPHFEYVMDTLRIRGINA